MSEPVDYLQELKNPEEAAMHLNSCLRDGRLEDFLCAIREVAQANRELKIDENTHCHNAEYANDEEMGEEIVTLLSLLHGLGLRLVPQHKIETEPIPVSLPESCKLPPDSLRKNRFGDVHTKEEVDYIVKSLDRVQYPNDTFIEYASRYYFYRNEFYRRGQNKTPLLTSIYADMATKENATLIYAHDIEPVIYRLVINYNQSLKDSIDNIEQFCDELKSVVRKQYLQDEEEAKQGAKDGDWGFMTLRNYLMDTKGRIMSDKIFKKWEELLLIYDTFEKEKTSKNVCLTLKMYDAADESNSYKYVRESREDAERLIKSAENGTFPY